MIINKNITLYSHQNDISSKLRGDPNTSDQRYCNVSQKETTER